MLLALWSGFWDWGPALDTHDGGVSLSDYRRYRRQLERVAKSAERFNEAKYIKKAVEVAQIVDDLPVTAPLIREVAQSVAQQQPIDIDFTRLQAELDAVLHYLNARIREQVWLARQREMDDEMALLALL